MMKNNFATFIVLLCLVLCIGLDWSAYFVCHNPQLHPDKFWMWAFCSVMTIGVALVNFIYFEMVDFRISRIRIKLASRCFASYFTRSALKDHGNVLKSFLYACNASHYFFLKSFHPCE